MIASPLTTVFRYGKYSRESRACRPTLSRDESHVAALLGPEIRDLSARYSIECNAPYLGWNQASKTPS